MGKKQYIKSSNQIEFASCLAAISDHKNFLLSSIISDFNLLGLEPIVGIELEFYLQNKTDLSGCSSKIINSFISCIKSEFLKQNIINFDAKPEQGNGQIEIKTSPYQDLFLLCDNIILVKKLIKNIADDFALVANFASQPYLSDCGSSLQINLSLIDKRGNFLFAKKDNQESALLLKCINQILSQTKQMLAVFAMQEDDYLRFDLEINKNLHKNKKYTAPVNISWGYENRTTLIRIPTSKYESERRLEFRLAASDSDIYLSIIFFLMMIINNINQATKAITPIYGNSFDNQYSCESLPKSLEKAVEFFIKNNQILENLIKKINAQNQ